VRDPPVPSALTRRVLEALKFELSRIFCGLDTNQSGQRKVAVGDIVEPLQDIEALRCGHGTVDQERFATAIMMSTCKSSWVPLFWGTILATRDWGITWEAQRDRTRAVRAFRPL
jgi:hypothetical protein